MHKNRLDSKSNPNILYLYLSVPPSLSIFCSIHIVEAAINCWMCLAYQCWNNKYKSAESNNRVKQNTHSSHMHEIALLNVKVNSVLLSIIFSFLRGLYIPVKICSSKMCGM